jgi:tetrahydromethanopterin S-methyltransferase subunit G
MSQESVEAILREIDLFRKENKESHDKIEARVATTNGKVADLVEWKIRVKTVLWIFGILMGSVVVPVGINLLSEVLKRHL